MEIEKIQLLHRSFSGAKTANLSENTVDFEIAGVRGRWASQGEWAHEATAYLREYLRPFQSTSESEPDFTIHFRIGENEFASPAHPFWNEWTPDFRPSQEKDGSKHFVVQRDFAASRDSGSSVIRAIGPQIHTGATDTIDNLLIFCFSRCLLANSALALHASCVERNGGAYVFFGASGAGKSTLARHCFDTGGLRVLSGDQIYLRVREGELWAHPCASTIPDFPRSHPGWCPYPRRVLGLIHLLQRPGSGRFIHLSSRELLPLFLRETIYFAEFGNAKNLLETAIAMTWANGVLHGELNYPQGSNFWPLIPELDARELKNQTRSEII